MSDNNRLVVGIIFIAVLLMGWALNDAKFKQLFVKTAVPVKMKASEKAETFYHHQGTKVIRTDSA